MNQPTESTETPNIVYVLTNSAMPGLVKIGKTTADDPSTRVSQLYTTGVPVPFEIEYACRVYNHSEVESALHVAFGPDRVNPRREFFKIEPEQAIAILRLLNLDDVTEEVKADSENIDAQDRQAAEKLKARRPNLNFEEMGIPIGSTLNSLKTDDVVTVVDAKKVDYREQRAISLSAATRDKLGTPYNVAPAGYWAFNGRSLKEIYEETYTDT